MYFANLRWAFMSAFQKELWKIPFHHNYDKRGNRRDDSWANFWGGTKACNWSSSPGASRKCNNTWEIKLRGLKVRLKGWRHLQDFAITNSLRIFYDIVLKNEDVSSVRLDGQKQDLALLLTLLVPRPSGGWLFLGLPRLFLLCSHFFQPFTADLLSLNPSCCWMEQTWLKVCM